MHRVNLKWSREGACPIVFPSSGWNTLKGRSDSLQSDVWNGIGPGHKNEVVEVGNKATVDAKLKVTRRSLCKREIAN